MVMVQEYLLAMSKNAPFVIMTVLGLGWLAGALGAKGKLQLAIAFLCGFVIDGSFQVAALGMPKDFAGWFWVFITAMIMGLAPSGFYEALKEGSSKAISWWLDVNKKE
jgi:hypothetical protein